MATSLHSTRDKTRLQEYLEAPVRDTNCSVFLMSPQIYKSAAKHAIPSIFFNTLCCELRYLVEKLLCGNFKGGKYNNLYPSQVSLFSSGHDELIDRHHPFSLDFKT